MHFCLLQVIIGQPPPVHSGEQTGRSQQPFLGQLNAGGVHNGLIDPQGMPPLEVVPSRYPDRLTELLCGESELECQCNADGSLIPAALKR